MYKVGAPVIIGPMNGGMTFPPAFQAMESRTERAAVWIGRKLSGVANLLVPGKRHASLLLVANERTAKALPPLLKAPVQYLVENGVDLTVWKPADATERPQKSGEAIRFVFMGRMIPLKAIDLLRQHESNFDSAADLITYLESLSQREETEGCEALSPNTNVVRVMNLHKAKGLEAPIVFLVDTAAPFAGLPICHVDRQGDTAVGYMGITKKHGKYHTREVATPANWSDRQREEQRFLEAERDRLLYVATTRAASMMIVSVGKEKSNWNALHRFLSDVPELTVPPQSKAVQASATTTTAATKAGDIATRWHVAMKPSYAIESAKESALKGIKRPDWQASGDFGYKWGSAVHELLEIASKSPSVSLTAPASRLAMRYDLGNERAEELLETINAVIRSDIWRRATESPRKFSELPFETRSDDGNGLPLITRGVIDLIFEESGQWVIVDYKTDDIAEKDVPSAVKYYRGQLTEYAKQWRATTNEPVSEIGLYFTRIDHYKALSPGDSPGQTS